MHAYSQTKNTSAHLYSVQREVYAALRMLQSEVKESAPKSEKDASGVALSSDVLAAGRTPNPSVDSTPVSNLLDTDRSRLRPAEAVAQGPEATGKQPPTASVAATATAAPARTLPPPRSYQALNVISSVPVSFTPRAFPTPARESKAAEEQDWLARNAQYIKAGGPGAASSTVKGVGRAPCKLIFPLNFSMHHLCDAMQVKN
jgi:hypothetical protein